MNAPILIINKINNKDQEHSDRKAEQFLRKQQNRIKKSIIYKAQKVKMKIYHK